MEKYLEEHSKPLKKPGTSKREFQLARKYVIPMLGNIPMDEINVRHLEKNAPYNRRNNTGASQSLFNVFILFSELVRKARISKTWH